MHVIESEFIQGASRKTAILGNVHITAVLYGESKMGTISESGRESATISMINVRQNGLLITFYCCLCFALLFRAFSHLMCVQKESLFMPSFLSFFFFVCSPTNKNGWSR